MLSCKKEKNRRTTKETTKKKKNNKGRAEIKDPLEEEGSRFKDPLEEEGLLCGILASLPPLEVFELRRVSKLWESVLSSWAYLQAWSLNHDNDGGAARPWLVMARKPVGSLPFARELIALDSSSGTWIPLDTLLASRCSEAALAALGGPSFPLVANPFRQPDDVATFDEFMAVGSQDGLTCFLCIPPKGAAPLSAEMVTELDLDDPSDVFEVGAYYLLVVNPVTGSHSILPPPLKHTPCLQSWEPWFYPRISLQALPHHHYRVFLQTSLYDHPGDLEIYESRSRSWKAGRSCWGHTDAKVGDALDLDKADLLQFAYGTATVFAYNVELDQWSHVYTTFVNGTYRFWLWLPNGTTLLRHRGRVLLAAVQFSHPYSPSSLAGFVVWELRPHANPPLDADHGVAVAEWVETARTPRQLLPDVRPNNSKNGMKTKLISSGSLICMTAVDYVDYYSGTFYTPLVYDLDCDSWYHLPPYKGCHDYVGVFGMRPSLAGMP